MTRDLAAGPDRFDGRSRYKSLSPRGYPSGWLVAGEGPTATILKGPVQLREFLFGSFVIDAFAHSLSYGGSGVVYPYPTASHVFGASKERVREGGVSPVYTSDCESVLFPHELVGALLPFSGKVAIGEMVAVEALMGSAVGAVEDGERETR